MVIGGYKVACKAKNFKKFFTTVNLILIQHIVQKEKKKKKKRKKICTSKSFKKSILVECDTTQWQKMDETQETKYIETFSLSETFRF